MRRVVALGIGTPDMGAPGLQEAKALPAPALPVAWPMCLKARGLPPLALVGAGEDAQVGRL